MGKFLGIGVLIVRLVDTIAESQVASTASRVNFQPDIRPAAAPPTDEQRLPLPRRRRARPGADRASLPPLRRRTEQDARKYRVKRLGMVPSTSVFQHLRRAGIARCVVTNSTTSSGFALSKRYHSRLVGNLAALPQTIQQRLKRFDGAESRRCDSADNRSLDRTPGAATSPLLVHRG